ncbi:MAG TPA: thiol:disulfide interchange protein DsbA/DsbL [Xanthomonadales bacterium]|nr:thiol:disulfide interchange protein DsbA/DsbL [Xanthomonadales bacterium]
MTIRTAWLLLLALVAPAATAAEFEQGKHYFEISPAQPLATIPGKVEVVEVFSYACGACALFQPEVDKWRAKAPAEAAFSYLPAAWNSNWEAFARAYYAADALGILLRSHRGVFKALHNDRVPLRTIDDIANWYTKFGVTKEQFLAAFNSPEVDARIAKSKAQVPAWQVDSTPSIVVAGKWRVTGASAGSPATLFEIVDHLVAQELAAAKR